MTHAANVIGGYVLTAVVVMAYAAWVVQRGRSLGRGLGIGNTGGSTDGDGNGHGEHERCEADAEPDGSEASGTPSAAEHSRDAAAPAS